MKFKNFFKDFNDTSEKNDNGFTKDCITALIVYIFMVILFNIDGEKILIFAPLYVGIMRTIRILIKHKKND